MTQNLNSIITGASTSLKFRRRTFLSSSRSGMFSLIFPHYPLPHGHLRAQDKTKDLVGLYSGIESTFWQHIYWNAGYFVAIYQIKYLLSPPLTKDRELPVTFFYWGSHWDGGEYSV
ncbi:hypothetical protein BKA70DRAFT_1426577 [Coprinopsis sp. MPI-PUGE-AT-0042]|nr:hypothetical protein BKA70DRAFT_1426577 [Coprinopsis sp. MPI-PUGE-AT-0042]